MNTSLIIHELFNIARNLCLLAYLIALFIIIFVQAFIPKENIRRWFRRHKKITFVFMVMVIAGCTIFILEIPTIVRTVTGKS